MPQDHRATVEESKRVALTLRRMIQEGRYAPRDPFPSLRELARRYDTSVRVARAATDFLVQEGLLIRRERSGTFVRPFSPPPLPSAGEPSLRCVTILERPTGTLPPFVRLDYLQGHTLALDDHPIRMRVMNLPDSLDRLESALSDRHPFKEQGCILINIVDESLFQWLNERGISFVVQNFRQYAKDLLPPHPSVVVNKVGGAYMATQHLIELGHRRIGYAGVRFFDNQEAVEVYEGYLSALRCAGIEARTQDLLPLKDVDIETAQAAALPLMRNRDLPTALVVQNDDAAIGILQAARTLGIRVPEDLSVVGFNDQAEAAQCDPPLTTVAVPRVQLGREAVETLLSLAPGADKEPVTKVLACHLVERGSTGAVDGGGRAVEVILVGTPLRGVRGRLGQPSLP